MVTPTEVAIARRTDFPESTFEYAFSIARQPDDDWLDIRLNADTALFVDPFLMFDIDEEPWNGVHDDLIAFFNTVLEHIAASGFNENSVHWNRAAQMLSFPEPYEFCLGYGKETIFGSGSGSAMGVSMLEAAVASIKAGINKISDFGPTRCSSVMVSEPTE